MTCGHEMEILRSPQMCLLEQQPEIHIIDADFNEGEHGVYIMQTHEDPEARRRFEIVNRILGWGNPCVPIWFIGLEEADEWGNPLTSKNEETLRKYEKCHTGWIPQAEGQIKEDALEWKKKYTKIYDIMSKLVLEVKGEKLSDWKIYRNEKLFIDPDACQANLYPLAKKNHKKKLPEKYGPLFGFNPEDSERYREIVSKTRFLELKKSWEQARPAITVCFGADEDDIKEVFGTLLGAKEAEFKIGNCSCALYSSGIILTPFFARYLMPNECIHGLVERLRPLLNHCTFPHNQL